MSAFIASTPGEVLVVLLVVAAAVGLHLLVQRRSDYGQFARHNEVAGFLLSVVGVMYAVVLGFVVVIVWQRYTATQGYVQDEAAAVSNVYRLAAAFPLPQRTVIRNDLRAYIDDVVRNEWPVMQRGEARGASGLLEQVAYDVDVFHPGNAGEADAHVVAMTQLQDLFEARRHRFAQVQPSVPPILWFALISVGLVTLGFTYFFGTENRGAQLLMTGALAGIIAVLFIVILEFDAPFRGSVAVQSGGWTNLAHRLPSIR